MTWGYVTWSKVTVQQTFSWSIIARWVCTTEEQHSELKQYVSTLGTAEANLYFFSQTESVNRRFDLHLDSVWFVVHQLWYFTHSLADLGSLHPNPLLWSLWNTSYITHLEKIIGISQLVFLSYIRSCMQEFEGWWKVELEHRYC